MSFAETVEVTLPSDREVAVRRSFDAPRALVFEAHTNPEIIRRWLHGPDEWPMVECVYEARPGGKIRYVWRHAAKGDMVMIGEVREIEPPAREVHTEIFEQDWTGGETIVTTTFDETSGRTTMMSTVLFVSKDARDAAMKTGMIEGWAQGLARLAGLLTSRA